MAHRTKTARAMGLVLVLASAAFGVSACSSTPATSASASAKTTSCGDFATLIATAVENNNGTTDQATVLKNGQALAQSLTDEAAKATDPTAHTAMTAFADDYTSLISAIRKADADAGDKAAAADVTAFSAKVTTDSAAVKTVCGN
ncbi:hypothetical protein KGQ20_23525 [Catenulispora sp. NF23]|uniref:hypothetical protein n=1 Tax=Catenulispora pinistramenti TaxID=2705254 RepID=UPI001BAA0FDC|nr:hypothetical protein [Catenulispora pinistramenti]MBS2535736.1 hypothetical protein [Catenulispora pinistramenti]